MLSGDKLKLLRINKGLSHQDLIDAIGVSERFITQVENKNVSMSEELYDKWIIALNTVEHVEHKRGRKPLAV